MAPNPRRTTSIGASHRRTVPLEEGAPVRERLPGNAQSLAGDVSAAEPRRLSQCNPRHVWGFVLFDPRRHSVSGEEGRTRPNAAVRTCNQHHEAAVIYYVNSVFTLAHDDPLALFSERMRPVLGISKLRLCNPRNFLVAIAGDKMRPSRITSGPCCRRPARAIIGTRRQALKCNRRRGRISAAGQPTT